VKKGNKMENKKWYTETYHAKFKRYEDLNDFLKPLNNEDRKVIVYYVKYGGVYEDDEITVTFARLK